MSKSLYEYCFQFQEDYNPTTYASQIELAINKIRDAIPRTMVHIVSMFDVTPLSNYSTGAICNIMHM